MDLNAFVPKAVFQRPHIQACPQSAPQPSDVAIATGFTPFFNQSNNLIFSIRNTILGIMTLSMYQSLGRDYSLH